MRDRLRAWLAMTILVMISLGVVYMMNVPPEEPVARSSEDHIWLRKEVVTVSATGTAGAATGSANTDRDLHGYIYGLHLDFTASISTTTDITLTQASPSLTILAVSNLYTDTWYYPVTQQAGSSGAGTSTYEKVLVQDAVDIAVGQTTSGTVGTVTIYWGQ